MHTTLAAKNISDLVSDALSAIAEALQVPVHIAALALLVLLALELGRAVIEGWLRIRPGRTPLLLVARQALADPQRAEEYARQAPSALAGTAVIRIAGARISGKLEAIEYALADFELGVQRRLDRTRMLVRFGPAVGLMGTLIPLAPGLTALGKGDVKVLTGDLRTAFGATVIGLLVGTVAFGLTLVRTRRYTEDLAALERAVETTAHPAVAAHSPANPPQAATQATANAPTGAPNHGVRQ